MKTIDITCDLCGKKVKTAYDTHIWSNTFNDISNDELKQTRLDVCGKCYIDFLKFRNQKKLETKNHDGTATN